MPGIRFERGNNRGHNTHLSIGVMAESLLARDCAVGCLHALVSVLQRALSTFITQHGANASAEGDAALEKLFTKAAKGHIRAQYQFICDHWEAHFESSLAHEIKHDLKLAVQVHVQSFHSPTTSEASLVRGIGAIERVLEAIEVTEQVMEHVDELKRIIRMHSDGDDNSECEDGNEDEEEEDEDTEDSGEEEDDSSAEVEELTAIALSKLCSPVEAMMEQRSQYPEVFVPAVEGELEMRRASVSELVDAGDAFLVWRDCRRAELCFSLALTRLQSPDVVRLDTDASPGDKEVMIKCLVQRAQSRLRLHQFDQVLIDVDAALCLDDEHLDALRLRCNAFIGLCDRESAIEACEKVLSVSPLDGAYESKLEHLQRCEELTHDVAFVLAVPPDLRKSASTRVDRATKELQLLAILGDELLLSDSTTESHEHGDVNSSITAYEDTLTRSMQLVEELAAIDDEEMVDTAETTAMYAKRAICRFTREDFDGAVDDVREVLSSVSSWITGWRLLCVALMHTEEWHEALAACDQVLKQDPDSGEFAAHRPFILSLIDAQKAEVEPTLEGNDVDNRDDSTSTIDEGTRADDSDGYESATEEERETEATPVTGEIPTAVDTVSIHVDEQVSSAASTSNEKISAISIEALAAYNAKKYREAASLFTEVLRLLAAGEDQQKKVKMYGHRIRCRLELQEFALALEDADAGLALQPEWVDGHRLKYKALMGLERWSEAKRECDIVVTAAPQDTAFATNRLTLESQLGEKTSVPVPPQTVVPAPPPPPSSHQPPPLPDSVELRTARDFIAKRDIAHALPWIKKELERSQKDSKSTASHRARVIALGAQCRFGLKQFPSVVRDAKEALAVDHGCVEAYRWLTAAQIKLKKYSEARTACATGLSLKPGHQELLLLRNQIDAENPLPKPASAFDKSDAQAKKAVELITTKQWARAVEMIQSSLVLLYAVDPSTDQTTVASKLVHLYGHRARCHMELQQFEAALKDAEAGLSVLPSWLEGHRLSCRALMGLKQWTMASIECEIVVRSAPQDIIFKQIQATLEEKLNATAANTTMPTPPASVQSPPLPPPLPPTPPPPAPPKQGDDAKDRILSLHSKAMGFMTASKYTTAEPLFTQAIALFNQSKAAITPYQIASLFVCRARCYVAMKKFQLALDDARRGQVANPSWPETYRLVCLALMGANRWPEALTACDEVLRRLPNNSMFKAHRETIVSKLPSTTATSPAPVTVQQSSAKSDDGSRKAERKRLNADAVRFMQSGNFAKAEELLDLAIGTYKVDTNAAAKSKKRAKIIKHRAHCRLQLKKFGLALQDARTVLRLDAKSLEGHHCECEALVGLQQWGEALSACGKALAIFPRDSTLKNLRATIRQEQSVAAAPPPPPPPAKERAIDKVVQSVAPLAAKPTVSQHSSQPTTTTAVRATSSDLNPPANRARAPSEVPSRQCISQITPAIERFAWNGLAIAACCVEAQGKLDTATKALLDGQVEAAFNAVYGALLLWRDIQIPESIAQELRHVGSHDALLWGGPLVYARLHASFKSADEEKHYWCERVDQFPDNIPVGIQYARALWKTGDVNALTRVVTRLRSLPLPPSPSSSLELVDVGWCEMSLLYLTACCGPTEKPWWSWLSPQSLPPRHESLQVFLEEAPIDEEWMPHVCYTLGMLSLKDKDYVRAKHFHYLALEVEARRAQLGVFAPIDENEAPEKKMLNRAFSGALLVLSKSEQLHALGRGDGLRCGWCRSDGIRVQSFIRHKVDQCKAKSINVRYHKYQ